MSKEYLIGLGIDGNNLFKNLKTKFFIKQNPLVRQGHRNSLSDKIAKTHPMPFSGIENGTSAIAATLWLAA